MAITEQLEAVLPSVESAPAIEVEAECEHFAIAVRVTEARRRVQLVGHDHDITVDHEMDKNLPPELLNETIGKYNELLRLVRELRSCEQESTAKTVDAEMKLDKVLQSLPVKLETMQPVLRVIYFVISVVSDLVHLQVPSLKIGQTYKEVMAGESIIIAVLKRAADEIELQKKLFEEHVQGSDDVQLNLLVSVMADVVYNLGNLANTLKNQYRSGERVMKNMGF